MPSLTYVQNFVEKLQAVSEIWPGTNSRVKKKERRRTKNNDKNNSLPFGETNYYNDDFNRRETQQDSRELATPGSTGTTSCPL